MRAMVLRGNRFQAFSGLHFAEGLVEDFSGLTRAGAALRAKARLLLQLAHRAAALISGLLDVAVGDLVTNTDKHMPILAANENDCQLIDKNNDLRFLRLVVGQSQTVIYSIISKRAKYKEALRAAYRLKLRCGNGR